MSKKTIYTEVHKFNNSLNNSLFKDFLDQLIEIDKKYPEAKIDVEMDGYFDIMASREETDDEYEERLKREKGRLYREVERKALLKDERRKEYEILKLEFGNE